MTNDNLLQVVVVVVLLVIVLRECGFLNKKSESFSSTDQPLPQNHDMAEVGIRLGKIDLIHNGKIQPLITEPIVLGLKLFADPNTHRQLHNNYPNMHQGLLRHPDDDRYSLLGNKNNNNYDQQEYNGDSERDRDLRRKMLMKLPESEFDHSNSY